MTETEKHWAAFLVGKEYSDGTNGKSTDGPDTFNCWGLVRWVFINVFGIAMPVISVGASAESRADAIRQVEDASGWRPCLDSLPRDRDILLMWSDSGRHVGLALHVNGGMHMLHAIEGTGVILTPFHELWALGMRDVTLWRKA